MNSRISDDVAMLHQVFCTEATMAILHRAQGVGSAPASRLVGCLCILEPVHVCLLYLNFSPMPILVGTR